MTPFYGILFDGPDTSGEMDDREAPAFFADLNLDQVIESITAGRGEYNLKPFFHVPLTSVQAIEYRHQIFRDLERKAVFDGIRTFAEKMRAMREHLAQARKLRYKHQKESWFLDAVEVYCGAVIGLADDLAQADVRSRGLLGFREHLAEYARSRPFTRLVAETKKLKEDLSKVRYCLHIRGNRVRVSRYESEPDYSADVEATFERFQQGAVKDYLVEFPGWPDMNHVEAQVAQLVGQLYPDVFSALDVYCDRNSGYLDATIGAFHREVQFYVAYLDYVGRLRSAGLTFCYPYVSDQSKEICASETFDLALANKLVAANSSVVCNDFYLKEPERILVVTGPNQGGKTTFARTFGQLHYLASVGCMVPGGGARLLLFDGLFTHFEKQENLQDLSGKLEDDLLRVREILSRATGRSIVIMNESFTSTTLSDALFLGRKVMEQLIQLDLLCVFVTFVDEMASLDEATVSMVSAVVPENPALRTFKLARRPADGLAYAAAIAEKYGLTYERLKARMDGTAR
jgi:DNA mismatch repair protein MutS